MTNVRIMPGDIYMVCDYHPVLCTSSDGEDVSGISLIDSSRPRSCSIDHCDVHRLNLSETTKLRDLWDVLFDSRKLYEEYLNYKSDIIVFCNNNSIIPKVVVALRKLPPVYFDERNKRDEFVAKVFSQLRPGQQYLSWQENTDDPYRLLMGFAVLNLFVEGMINLGFKNNISLSVLGEEYAADILATESK